MRSARHVLTITLLAALAVLSGGVGWATASLPVFTAGEFAVSESVEETADKSAPMLFVGDIMLARHVERITRFEGLEYPWRGVQEIFATAGMVVGNFESAIPRTHTPTPDFTFRFSTPYPLVAAMASAGVTHVSLANNHSFDFGADNFTHTRDQVLAAGIEPFGHPFLIDGTSVSYVHNGTHTIGLIGIHTLFKTPTESELAPLLASVRAQSDVQIAYIHWGIEYEYEPSESQRTLAHTLIKHGVSAIIGHHPHVVQNIELVAGVPVFYSLGNFIFDQYFNLSVQEGLVLQVDVHDTTLTYTLIPVTSHLTRSQPRIMEETARTDFLTALAERSDPRIQTAITNGYITQYLATSSQNSMMTE